MTKYHIGVTTKGLQTLQAFYFLQFSFCIQSLNKTSLSTKYHFKRTTLWEMSMYNIKYLCLFLSSSASTLNLIVLWQIFQSLIKNFEGISLKVEMFKIEFSRNYTKLAIKVYVRVK